MANDVQAEMPSRTNYEGANGWNDGRLGQVYDLLYSVLSDMGEKPFGHPLLNQIESLDSEVRK